MRLHASFGLALRRLARRPIRTVLLLQGTIWGVAVAIFPSAVIQGTRAAALEQGAALGADRIAIAADPTSAQGANLSSRDLAVVREAAETAGHAPRALGGVRILRTLAPLRPGSGSAVLTVLAASPGAEAARGLALARGRWLRSDDGPDRCVLEAGVARWLGDLDVAPGRRIQLPGWPSELEVVGVAEARDARARRTSDLGFDLEHPMYRKLARGLLLAMGLPIVQDDWKRSGCCVYVASPDATAGAPLDWMFLRVDPRGVSGVATSVRDALARRGKAVLTLYPLVLPVLMGAEVDRFAAVNRAMFLACLAMGAMVMLNLGLLNVLTRRREIAIRRTEGATARDIARQFVAEGFLLAVVGAALGCVFGVVLAALRAALEPVTGFTWAFPYAEAGVAVAVALFVGALASLLPAWKASRQDPVEGLADE